MMISTLTFAQQGTALMDQLNKANQFYEKGEIDQAGELYQTLIQKGFEGPELYYNLGNIFYRKGERGKAVLWYERAHLLAPRDSDIAFNLSLAKSHIKEEEGNLLRRIFLTFSENELSVALTLLLWLFFGILGARTLRWIKNESWTTPLLWFLGLSLSLLTLWSGVSLTFHRQPTGIVVNPPGEVRNGPGSDYAVGFTIPEGSQVLILNRRPEWTQVGVPHQGLKGWMPNTDVEPLRLTPPSLN